MSYKGQKSNPFPWLYLDYKTLATIAADCGLDCTKLADGNHYDYLAKLTPRQ